MRGKRVEGGRVRREVRMKVLRAGRAGRGASTAPDFWRVVMKVLRARTEGSVPEGPSLAISLSIGGGLE